MKRKVTDLKPNEAILISNDAERDAILQLMDISNFKWNSGDAPFDRNIRTAYPYCLAYKFRSIDFIPSDGIRVVNKNSFYEAGMIYPATDFIGSEGESGGLTVSERDLLADYHNFILDDPRAKECDVVGECVELFLLTRNTPTNERTSTDI
jgi:hypothetical protein